MIKVKQSLLNEALGTVVAAAATRSTLPVLENILIIGDGDKLKVSAQNNSMSITTWIEADLPDSDGITLPAKKICDLVNKLPDDGIFIDIDNNRYRAEIVCGKSKTTLSGLNYEEYPIVPVLQKVLFESSCRLFRDALDKALVAVAMDESRPVLSGVCTKFSNGSIDFACADGFRLSVCSQKVENDFEHSITVPHSVMSQVSKIAGKMETVKIWCDDRHIVFEMENGNGKKVVVTGQLIEGQYPDYTQMLMNQNHDKFVTFETSEFIRALDLVMITAQDNDYFVKIEIVDSGMNVNATSSENASANFVSCNVDGDTGLVIAVNIKFLLQALRKVSDKEITFCFGDGTTPIMFTDDYWSHVIMPMHLRG